MIAIVDRNTTSGVGERGMEDVPIAEQAEARAFLAHHAIELGLDRRTPQQVCAELVLLTETQKDQAMLEMKNTVITDEIAYKYWKEWLDLAWIKPENMALFQENHPSYEWMDKSLRKAKIKELIDKFYTEVWRGQLLLEKYLDSNGFSEDAPFTFMEMLQDASFDTVAFVSLKENSEEILEYKELHKREVKKLEDRKKELASERLGFIRLLERWKISEDDYDKLVDENKRSIDLVIEKIDEFEKGSEKEELIARIPEILAKTFELNTKVHRNQQISEMKDDLLKLLQITTFELTVDNQKELKVKLFEVLDSIISNEKWIMEPPSGLEPETSSLPMKCSTTELWRHLYEMSSDIIWSIMKIQVFVTFIIFSLTSMSHFPWSVCIVSRFTSSGSISHPFVLSLNIIFSICICSSESDSSFSFFQR